MSLNQGIFEEEIFRDEQAIPLSDQEAFLIMQKAKETAQEGLNRGEHPLLRNAEFLEFLKYQEKIICNENQVNCDQISKDAQLLRERFNLMSELTNPEIALFLNLKPQTTDEAISLIPSLRRLGKEMTQETIQKALEIYKNVHLTFK